MCNLIRFLLFFGIFLTSTSELLAKKHVKIEEREVPPQNAESSIKSLFNSLDPHSVSQHLAFYELYPETKEGKASLKRAWSLLSGGVSMSDKDSATTLPVVDIQAILSLITRQSFESRVPLNKQQLELIAKISERLTNRKIKGHQVWTKEEILRLLPEEVDIARGLLVFQLDESPDAKNEILQYEASIDLMALQIATRLLLNASNEDKIREINRFIFQEMQFRFPPIPFMPMTSIFTHFFRPYWITDRVYAWAYPSFIWLSRSD